MGVVDFLIAAGLAVTVLGVAAGLLYFAYQIWRCSLAAASGGGSRRRGPAAEDATYRTARAAYIAHRDRAGLGMITLLLSLFFGIGVAFVGDYWGSWPERIRAVCEGVELCE